MEDEYKVVCALSNSATIDGLERPRTPVSRSQYSLKANISQTVPPIHYVWFQARVFGVGGSNGAISGSIISKMADAGHLVMSALSVARNPCVSWAFLLGRPEQPFRTGLCFTRDVIFFFATRSPRSVHRSP